MTKYTKILLILFLLSSLKAHSQKVLAGFQLGPNHGYPNGGIDGVWGINLAFVNKNGIILETGKYKSMIDYGYANLPFGNTFTSSQIPLRLQKRINVFKNKIFINPSAGLSYLYHVNAHINQGHGYGVHGVDTTLYTFSGQSLHRNGFLGEAGAKVELIILKHLSLNFACYYSKGFRSLAQSTCTYNQPSQGKSGEEVVTSKGSNLQFFAGLSFSIYDKQRWDSKVHRKSNVFHNQILLGAQLGLKNYGYPGANNNGEALGINLTFVNKKGILLETGILGSDIYYNKKIDVGGNSISFGNYLWTQEIPLRLQKRISILDNIFFTPSAGINFLHISNSVGSPTNSKWSRNGDTIYITENSKFIHKNGISPSVGAKAEFILFSNLVMNLSSYYTYGLLQLAETTYSYNEPSQNISGTGKVTSKGNNLRFSIGLSYCIYDKQRRQGRKNN